ncbi:cell wall-active antibiotics response protein LiaF [Brevibacillus humidisoli]|uniref:cell wall-active antibiotics response protein LiaF n=1 Tax=Brevibacillus humidisoli TaxID=2895522 RepID=UPI001E54C1A7|nr:cell wall-active antibiotics response protein LiaF [Brevibacillus humidisoli]UFJ41258.1 cell wall-active antibiotics response protein LiaF [Brevibacillus humidisoli]
MKSTRLQKMIVGIVVIFIGVKLLLGSIGLIPFSVWDLWPLLIIYFGWRFWLRQRRILGGILLGWGGLLALEEWFYISVDDAIGLLVAVGLVYLGFRLIRSRRDAESEYCEQEPEAAAAVNEAETPRGRAYQKQRGTWWKGEHRTFQEAERVWKSYREKGKAYWQTGKRHDSDQTANRHRMRFESPFEPGHVFSPHESRSSLIGDFHLTSGRFELRDLHIWHGVGDVKIDLSRALILEEETFLLVNGWVGDVTIYVPVDLAVSVAAEVTIGDIDVFGHRQGGINRQVVMKSQDYDDTSRKVKIIVSLIVGDIDVRYI